MAVWSTLFLEVRARARRKRLVSQRGGLLILRLAQFWKRKQSSYAMYWGQTNFESQQTDRPEFGMAVDRKGKSLVQTIHSPVTGEDETFFPEETASFRKNVSMAIISVWLLVVFVCVVFIMMAKAATSSPDYNINIPLLFPKKDGDPSKPGLAVWGPIWGIANAAQVQIFQYLYKKKTAEGLNKYENHRTETAFEDALIAKVFIFNFINTFMVVFYVAFIQQPFAEMMGARTAFCIKISVDGVPQASCMAELGTKLGSLFLAELVVKNGTEIFIP